MWEIDHHTADVRIRVRAASLEELFADALRGLAEVMHPLGAGEELGAPIDLRASDATSLLVDFLNEALTRAHIERAAFTRVEVVSLTETSMRAAIRGERCDGFEEDVKSVTYHEAQVARDAQGWGVTLVLDI